MTKLLRNEIVNLRYEIYDASIYKIHDDPRLILVSTLFGDRKFNDRGFADTFSYP